jgi:thioredoxin-dependent peroxiredoxin
MNLKPGDSFPQFCLPDIQGELFDSNSLKGIKAMVVYFYPKDETTGCTKQACAFRDSYQDFKDAAAEVIGISSDSSSTHKDFALNHKLPFILLSDRNGEFRKKVGVPTNLLGLLPGRVTYIIDSSGMIQYIFNSQLHVEKHIIEALNALKKIGN